MQEKRSTLKERSFLEKFGTPEPKTIIGGTRKIPNNFIIQVYRPNFFTASPVWCMAEVFRP